VIGSWGYFARNTLQLKRYLPGQSLTTWPKPVHRPLLDCWPASVGRGIQRGEQRAVRLMGKLIMPGL
jgi:hypothetical protein